MMSIEWAAGLFEGEGCISISKGSGGRAYPVLCLASTDLDTLQRFHEAIGHVGTLWSYARKVKAAHHKPLWEWRMRGHDDVSALLDRLKPFLGQRRSARAEEVLRMSGKSLAAFPNQSRRHQTSSLHRPEEVAEVVALVLSRSGKQHLADMVLADPTTMRESLGINENFA